MDAKRQNCAELAETAPTPAASSSAAHCQTVLLHAAAPGKPVPGVSCNGCGICCAAEPCPLSRILLRHRRGSCPALSWSGDEARYFCGLVARPSAHLRWLPRRADKMFGRLARRWIAAGIGCDFDAEAIAGDD